MSLELAVDVLEKGGIIAYPTESTFGLGCDPFNTVVIERLQEIKQREADKGMIVVVANWSQVEELVEWQDEIQKDMIEQTWPGHITWVFPAKKSLSPRLCGPHHTIAIRMSAEPLIKELCDQFGHGVVSTSANVSHKTAVTTMMEAKSVFAEQVDFYVDEKVGAAKGPSKIIDAITCKIYR